MFKVKLVRELVKMKYGNNPFYTLWCKGEEDNEWYFMDISEDLGDIDMGGELYSERIAKAINSWDYTWRNEIVKDTKHNDCELCGGYTDTTVKINFRDSKLPSIIETYSSHFGDGTSDEELIEQFKKAGIELTIEYDI